MPNKIPMSFKVQLVDDETGEVLIQETTKDPKVAFYVLQRLENYYKKMALEEKVPF